MYLCKNGCWSALTSPVLHQTMHCILTYPHLNLRFIICAFEFNLFLHLRRARRYLTPPNLHKWRGASDAAAKPNLLQIFAHQIFAVLCTTKYSPQLAQKIFARFAQKKSTFCTKKAYKQKLYCNITHIYQHSTVNVRGATKRR